MTFAIFTNIVLVALCSAVVIQNIRVMRSFRAMRSSELADTVTQLDAATQRAHRVLGELRTILATDGAASVRTIASGESLRDELSVMVGIGNAVAERIMEAAAVAKEEAKPARKAASKPAAAAKATTKTKTKRAPAPRRKPERGTLETALQGAH